MRKISAHFCLLPDGSLAKMPVISIDENGVIRDIMVLGDGFVEEHSVELFGGVLVPGFIEDFRDVNLPDGAPGFSIEVNRMYSNGSLKYLCNSCNKLFPTNFKGEVFCESSIKKGEELRGIPKQSVWEGIKKRSVEGGVNIFESTHHYFSDMRNLIPDELRWGAIEQGANPGILLIKGLDYERMQLRENATIKILIS
jgi:hypothetical protein